MACQYLMCAFSRIRLTLTDIGTMSDLELEDVEADGWLAAQAPPERPFGLPVIRQGQLHLLLGDSIPKRAVFSTKQPGDLVLNRSEGGESWLSILERIDRYITSWLTAAAASGLNPGKAIVWLTGNDVYSRATGLARFTDESLREIGRAARVVVQRLRTHATEVVILGPLPRLAGDLYGCTWNSTAAYKLERTLIRNGPGDIATIITLGRLLTRKMGRKRNGIKGCEMWFHPDGVHLSPEGYSKLAGADAFPDWLVMRARK